jgi:hypothetical protein
MLAQRGNAERRVAFHTADLSPQERQVLESGFSGSKFEVCFATTTLAANIALQAGAWFAAAAVASSALESMLLSKCFLQEAEVRGLSKFQTSKPKYRKDFGIFARSLDLGNLLQIANELAWFPDGGVPKLFSDCLAEHLDADTLATLLGLFEGGPNVERTCARHLREYRNLLHPAVCLREQRMPSKEAGMTATFLFMIAVLSLSGSA